MSARAEELKRQIDTVLQEVYDAQNPNPLARLARKSYISVRLLTPDRRAHYGMANVRSDEPVLYENRLWFWYQNATWVMEYDAEDREWSAVEATLPVGRWSRSDEWVPASAGAEIRSVLPIKYKATNSKGQEVWKRTEVSPRPACWEPICWARSCQRPIYRDGRDDKNHFRLGKTVYDYDGRTVYEAELQSVYEAELQSVFMGGSGGRTTDTIKLLLQTERLVDGVTIGEKYIEAQADDLEEREVDGEELTVYTDDEGHEYGVDTAGVIERDGVKTYRAVRVV